MRYFFGASGFCVGVAHILGEALPARPPPPWPSPSRGGDCFLRASSTSLEKRRFRLTLSSPLRGRIKVGEKTRTSRDHNMRGIPTGKPEGPLFQHPESGGISGWRGSRG